MTADPRPQPDPTRPAAATAPAPTVPEPSDAVAPPTRGDGDVPEYVRKLRTLRAVLWALVGVTVAAWLFFGDGLESLTSLFRASNATGTADVGQPAPDLRLPLAGGGEVSLAQHRGSVVLVNYWATWCTPCRAEMPVFERAYQTHGSRGLVVLGVDVQERDADVLAFLREVGATFPSAIDPTGETTRTWRAVGLPTTFLIDRQGVIRDVRIGPYTDQMLEERLVRLLSS